MLCLSLSLVGSLAQISVPITPCVSSKNMNGSCTSQTHLSSSSLLCAASSRFFTSYTQPPVEYSLRVVLCGSQCHFSSLQHLLIPPTKWLWLQWEWQWQHNSWQIISVLNKSLICLNASLLWQQEEGLWASGTLTVQKTHLHSDICYYRGDPLLF